VLELGLPAGLPRQAPKRYHFTSSS
jgi:hypothetical protein